MQKKYPVGLMWFRRDLRAFDNAALHHALKSCQQVHCVFVFDREILDTLPRQDRRVEFIWEAITELHEQLTLLAAEATKLFPPSFEMLDPPTVRAKAMAFFKKNLG